MQTKTKRAIWGVLAGAAVVGWLAGCSAQHPNMMPQDVQPVPAIIDVDVSYGMCLAADTPPADSASQPQPLRLAAAQ